MTSLQRITWSKQFDGKLVAQNFAEIVILSFFKCNITYKEFLEDKCLDFIQEKPNMMPLTIARIG